MAVIAIALSAAILLNLFVITHIDSRNGFKNPRKERLPSPFFRVIPGDPAIFLVNNVHP